MIDQDRSRADFDMRGVQVLLVATGAYVAASLIANVLSVRTVVVAGWPIDAGTLTYPLPFTLRDVIHKRGGAVLARWVIVSTAVFNLALALGIWATANLPGDPTMPLSDLPYATVTELAAAFRAKTLSPVEVTQAMLERIAKLDGSLHAYVTLTPEIALEQARRAEAEFARGEHRGPMQGVPVGIKDLCETKGVRTTWGTKILRDHTPERDCTVVRKLFDAGAVMLGKLQMTEGAFSVHHPEVVAPVNPWHAEHWPGVSSSGSGVAPAAGMCYGAIGTDTGGSIRFPSGANAITGLKPTWGRVSRHGVQPLADSLDHLGPMCRTAADGKRIEPPVSVPIAP